MTPWQIAEMIIGGAGGEVDPMQVANLLNDQGYGRQGSYTDPAAWYAHDNPPQQQAPPPPAPAPQPETPTGPQPGTPGNPAPMPWQQPQPQGLPPMYGGMGGGMPGMGGGMPNMYGGGMPGMGGGMPGMYGGGGFGGNLGMMNPYGMRGLFGGVNPGLAYTDLVPKLPEGYEMFRPAPWAQMPMWPLMPPSVRNDSGGGIPPWEGAVWPTMGPRG